MKNNIDLYRMEVSADFLESVDLALQAFTKLNESAIYLNFENKDQIQRYFNALEDVTKGTTALKEGFYFLAKSHAIELEQHP